MRALPGRPARHMGTQNKREDPHEECALISLASDRHPHTSTLMICLYCSIWGAALSREDSLSFHPLGEEGRLFVGRSLRLLSW